jgi:hypothetical protein
MSLSGHTGSGLSGFTRSGYIGPLLERRRAAPLSVCRQFRAGVRWICPAAGPERPHGCSGPNVQPIGRLAGGLFCMEVSRCAASTLCSSTC